jgi:hypothetical protein
VKGADSEAGPWNPGPASFAEANVHCGAEANVYCSSLGRLLNRRWSDAQTIRRLLAEERGRMCGSRTIRFCSCV